LSVGFVLTWESFNETRMIYCAVWRRAQPSANESNQMRCEICLKAGMSGNNVSHSNRHTKTRFVANVHKQTLVREGKSVKVKICTRCLRSLHKSKKVQKVFAAL
jgi:large subunit ribosomal protein L28